MAFDPAFLKFAIPAVGTAVLLGRFRHGQALAGAWHRPAPRDAAYFAALYLGWMLFTDLMLDWRGPWDVEPWLRAPLLHSTFRVLGVCLAGPLLEELVFRGLLFGWLRSRGWSAASTIGLTAALWSVIHYEYEFAVIGVIFVAGLILGLARFRSGSLILPVGLHMLWNLYAVW